MLIDGSAVGTWRAAAERGLKILVTCGEAMPAADDWQADVAVALQRAGAAVTDALDVLPGWFAAIVVLGIVATLGHRAWRQTTHPNSDPTDIPASTDHTTVTTDSEDSNEPHPHVQQQP